jgi:uncharacterized coiled-coil DUF342 family protein
MDDRQWDNATVDEKLNWLRSFVVGLPKHYDEQMTKLHEGLDDVFKEIDELRTEIGGNGAEKSSA